MPSQLLANEEIKGSPKTVAKSRPGFVFFQHDHRAGAIVILPGADEKRRERSSKHDSPPCCSLPLPPSDARFTWPTSGLPANKISPTAWHIFPLDLARESARLVYITIVFRRCPVSAAIHGRFSSAEDMPPAPKPTLNCQTRGQIARRGRFSQQPSSQPLATTDDFFPESERVVKKSKKSPAASRPFSSRGGPLPGQYSSLRRTIGKMVFLSRHAGPIPPLTR